MYCWTVSMLSVSAIVTVKWILGHSGKQGNEEADAIARSGLRMLPSPDSQPGSISLAYLRRLMNNQLQALLSDWWDKACPVRYRKLDLLMKRRKPPELALSRHLLRELIAARTGHGNFAAYHRRFNNADAPSECACGKETSPTHFIHCRLYSHETRRIRGLKSHDDFLHQLLGPKCLEDFRNLAQKIQCYG